MKTNKEPVRLRQKEIKGGNKSLYLDIYTGGQRSYEFLRLYLVPERNKADREANKQTMQIANTIKAKRIIELQSGVFGLRNSNKADVYFNDYVDKLVKEKRISTNLHASIKIQVATFAGDDKVKMGDINEKWAEHFRNFIQEEAGSLRGKRENGRLPLHQNSRWLLYGKFKSIISCAINDSIFVANPLRNVKPVPKEATKREFLTIDELRLLAQTECRSKLLKKAFLFSCLTGLRISDIRLLKWSMVEDAPAGNSRITFVQKKTKGLQYLDISAQARSLMGERGDDTAPVFLNLPRSTDVSKYVAIWIAESGIKKHITFHCARHTFAVMMLDLGTDIYTVSKLLGHASVATTQVYAAVLDKNKQQAMNKIPDIF